MPALRAWQRENERIRNTPLPDTLFGRPVTVFGIVASCAHPWLIISALFSNRWKEILLWTHNCHNTLLGKSVEITRCPFLTHFCAFLGLAPRRISCNNAWPFRPAGRSVVLPVALGKYSYAIGKVQHRSSMIRRRVVGLVLGGMDVSLLAGKFVASRLAAQVVKGSISGTVVDPAASAVRDVEVTAVN